MIYISLHHQNQTKCFCFNAVYPNVFRICLHMVLVRCELIELVALFGLKVCFQDSLHDDT